MYYTFTYIYEKLQIPPPKSNAAWPSNAATRPRSSTAWTHTSAAVKAGFSGKLSYPLTAPILKQGTKRRKKRKREKRAGATSNSIGVSKLITRTWIYLHTADSVRRKAQMSSAVWITVMIRISDMHPTRQRHRIGWWGWGWRSRMGRTRCLRRRTRSRRLAAGRLIVTLGLEGTRDRVRGMLWIITGASVNVKVWKRVFDKLKKRQRGKRGRQRRDGEGGLVYYDLTILKWI